MPIAIIIVLVIIALLVSVKFITKSSLSVEENVVDASDYLVPHNQIGSVALQTLSVQEQEGLIMMREEEKLAHDVYMTLYEQWKLNTFRNIAGSESTHTESVRYLLERYSIEDPVKISEIGVFSNQDFATLYSELVNKGKISLTDALTVGAMVEDLDIKDLQELINETDNEDIKIVYDNLMRGSRNHLRSFSRQLVRMGINYSAQYLSQQEVDDILSGAQERGW